MPNIADVQVSNKSHDAENELETKLEELKQLHKKGLLSREAYTAAQLDVLKQ